jgi:hypothetical protein
VIKCYKRYLCADSQLEFLLTFKPIDNNKARSPSYILNYDPIVYAVTATSAANPGVYDKPIKANMARARIQQIRMAILIDLLLIQFQIRWPGYSSATVYIVIVALAEELLVLFTLLVTSLAETLALGGV